MPSLSAMTPTLRAFLNLALVRSYLVEDEEGELWRVEVRSGGPDGTGPYLSARFKVGTPCG